MGKLEAKENQTMIKIRVAFYTVKKYLYLYKVMMNVHKGKCAKREKLLINLFRRYFTMWETEGMVNFGLSAKHVFVDSPDEGTMNRTSVNRELPLH